MQDAETNNRIAKMNNRTKGTAGEDLACRYLEKSGYKILERNKHYSKYCEIDIIAEQRGTIVFVEVKTRQTNAFGTPFEAITQTKLHHLKTGIMNYLTEHKVKKYRLDIVGITLKPELKIEHIKGAGLL